MNHGSRSDSSRHGGRCPRAGTRAAPRHRSRQAPRRARSTSHGFGGQNIEVPSPWGRPGAAGRHEADAGSRRKAAVHSGDTIVARAEKAACGLQKVTSAAIQAAGPASAAWPLLHVHGSCWSTSTSRSSGVSTRVLCGWVSSLGIGGCMKAGRVRASATISRQGSSPGYVGGQATQEIAPCLGLNRIGSVAAPMQRERTELHAEAGARGPADADAGTADRARGFLKEVQREMEH